MTLAIDMNTYNKASKFDEGHGWGPLYDGGPSTRRASDILSIIVHTTNGKRGTSFINEANFLFTSPKVSAHYLVGKSPNKVAQFLLPTQYAYHTGDVIDSVYSNKHSIGIEVHNTEGEKWTEAQHESLTNLVDYLLESYPSIKYIETHRRAAYPKGRKSDPSGFGDTAFYKWRDERLAKRGIITFTAPKTYRFRVIYDNAIIRQGPSRAHPQSGTLNKNDMFLSISLKKDELNQVIGGIDTWAHVTEGTTQNGDSVSNLGFVHQSSLKLIG